MYWLIHIGELCILFSLFWFKVLGTVHMGRLSCNLSKYVWRGWQYFFILISYLSTRCILLWPAYGNLDDNTATAKQSLIAWLGQKTKLASRATRLGRRPGAACGHCSTKIWPGKGRVEHEHKCWEKEGAMPRCYIEEHASIAAGADGHLRRH